MKDKRSVLKAGRPWFALVLLTMLAMAVSGCVGSVSTPEPRSISLAVGRYDNNAAAIQALTRTFEEQNPHITVDVQMMPRGDLIDTSDADVFFTSEARLRDMAGEGRLLDLTPLLEQEQAFSLQDFHHEAVAALSSEGRIWAIPSVLDFTLMYYNKDLLDAKGVPYPEAGWTWDDFLQVAKALRDPDQGILGFATFSSWMDGALAVGSHGGSFYDDPDNPTSIAWEDPLTLEALEWYAGLYNEHHVAATRDEMRQDYGGGSTDQVFFLVGEGRVAMWRSWFNQRGSGQLAQIDFPFRWGVVPFPREAEAITYAASDGYAISSQTLDAQTAWQLVSYLSQQMLPVGFPALRSLAESEAFVDEVGREVADVAYLAMADAVMIGLEFRPEFSDSYDMFGEVMEQIVEHQVGVQEALESARQSLTQLGE